MVLNWFRRILTREMLIYFVGFSLSLSYLNLQTDRVSFCAEKHARSLLFLQGRRPWQWDAIRRQKKNLFTLKRVHHICSYSSFSDTHVLCLPEINLLLLIASPLTLNLCVYIFLFFFFFSFISFGLHRDDEHHHHAGRIF